MERKVQKRISEDAIEMWKKNLPSLYITYRGGNQDEIRLVVLEALTKHIAQKTRQALNRKIRAKTKIIHEVLDPTTAKQAIELDF